MRRFLAWTLLLVLFVIPLTALSVSASDWELYESQVETEFFDQYMIIKLPETQIPAINIKLDFSKLGVSYSENSGYNYTSGDSGSQKYPMFLGSYFYSRSDRSWTEDKQRAIEEGTMYGSASIWGYDANYTATMDIYTDPELPGDLWYLTAYVNIPSLTLPDGTYFCIVISVYNEYPTGTYDAQFMLRTLVENITVSFEKPETAQSLTVINDAGNTEGDDTSASENIPKAVAVGIVGAAAAAAGIAAGTSAASTGGVNGDDAPRKPKGRLRMVISKNFGQYIRYGDEHVFVYARIVEISDDGEQHDRSDLTSLIRITTSSSCLDLGSCVMSGDSMGASVRAPGHQDIKQTEAVISFILESGEVSFTNNVVFKMMDWADIRMDERCTICESEKGNPDMLEMPYELINFFDLQTATVMLDMKDKSLPLKVELLEEEQGKGKIRITAVKGLSESGMFSHYFAVLKAQSDKDKAEKSLTITICREGLYIEFGKDEESVIKCYKKTDTDEMEQTRVLVGLALYDRNTRIFRVIAPDKVQLKISDEKNIGEKIGLKVTRMPGTVNGHLADNQRFSDFRLKAIKPLPYDRDITASLEATCIYGTERFRAKRAVTLKPDIFWYYDEFDKQYEKLHKLVCDSFSPDISKHYTHQLDLIRVRMGLADLQSYEKHIRTAAQDILEQRAVSELATADNWDMAVSALEWTAWVGDICFDLLIGAFTGPIGVVLAEGGKELIVEVARRMLSDKGFSCDQIVDIAWDKLTGSLTKNVDGFLEFPRPPAYVKIALWMVVYTVYRLFWHWYNDIDPVTGKPLGLENACSMAARDVMVDSLLKAGLDKMLRGRLQLSKDVDGKPIYSENVRKTMHNLRSADEKLVKDIKSGEALTDALSYTIHAADDLANSAMHAFVHLLQYLSDKADEALIASLKAIGIIN